MIVLDCNEFNKFSKITIAPVLNIQLKYIQFQFNSILIGQYYFQNSFSVTMNKFEPQSLVCHHRNMNPHFQQLL